MILNWRFCQFSLCEAGQSMKTNRLVGAWCVISLGLAYAAIVEAQEAPVPAGTVQTFNEELGLKLVWCPAGTFRMGSPDSDKGALDHEKPQHTVELTSGFWLGQTEVTQGQWQSVMGTSPWQGQEYIKEGADYPATYVSWKDAQAFCQKLTEQERGAGRLSSGMEYRLPTEAQWEYACRAGTTTKYSFGDDEKLLSVYGWWRGNVPADENAKNERHAHRVGMKQPNPWGLYDMHGNVTEWCQDWYESEYYGSSPGSDPQGPSKALYRVFRGGSFYGAGEYSRSAARRWHLPDDRVLNFGFRVALVPAGQ